MSVINDTIDLIETKLLENANWGPSSADIYWGNLEDGNTQIPQADLPKTLVFIEQAPQTEATSLSDETEYIVQVKNFSWVGSVAHTKANMKTALDLHNEFVTIYNNIVENLDCAWLTDYLNFDYENIDDRLILQERFSITVTENR